MKRLCDPLLWLIVLFLLLLFGLPYSQPFFAALFPDLPRPVYQQESFAALALAHFWLVGISSLFAVVVGVGAGIAVTRESGKEFRPLVETIAAVGQTFPPVAVLAIAVPVMGFGQQPAIIALILYGVLPILQATLAGLGAVPASVMSVASGMGMSRRQQLYQVDAAGRAGDSGGHPNLGDYQYWYGDHRFNGGGQYVRHADHYRA